MDNCGRGDLVARPPSCAHVAGAIADYRDTDPTVVSPRFPNVVDVYRNLTRSCWSVRDAATRLVVAHVDRIVLRDCSMHVSEAGRQRVLHERRRNVHAFVRGAPTTLVVRPRTRLRYNPYTMCGFVCASGATVRSADVVLFNERGHAWARGLV